MSQYIFERRSENIRLSGKVKFLQDIIDEKYLPGEKLPPTAVMRQIYANGSNSQLVNIVADLKEDGIITGGGNQRREGLKLSYDCFRAIDIIHRDVLQQLEYALDDCVKYRISREMVESLIHQKYDDSKNFD